MLAKVKSIRLGEKQASRCVRPRAMLPRHFIAAVAQLLDGLIHAAAGFGVDPLGGVDHRETVWCETPARAATSRRVTRERGMLSRQALSSGLWVWADVTGHVTGNMIL